MNSTYLQSVVVAVYDASLRVLIDAYEDAGVRGMCHEGRWEYALDVLRKSDPATVVDKRR